MAETSSQKLLKEALMKETKEVLESRLENLKETIDDPNAKIGERIHALLLLLRSRKAEEENLHVHACPASPQISDSPGFNRPEEKPNYVINTAPYVTKTSSQLSNHAIKSHRRISFEEMDERRSNGLCLFCEELETSDHYLRHKNLGILMIEGDEDQLLKDKIGCDLEVVEADSSNQEINELCTENEGDVNGWIQEKPENHSMDPVLESSLAPHMCSLLKYQVSTSHLEFSHRSFIESLDVYDDWRSVIVRTHQAQSNFDLEYAAISAHQVFDSMPLGTKLLTNGRRETFLKTWWFKFKDKTQPRALIQEKLGVHETNATMNQLMSPIGFLVDDLHSNCGIDIVCTPYLASSVVVGDFQLTPLFFKENSKDIQKFQIVTEEGSNSHAYQEFNGMSLGSHTLHQQKKPSKSPKSWKFKFKINSEDSKLTCTKFWCEKTKRSSKKKLMCGTSWKFHYKNRVIQGELVKTGTPSKGLRLKQHQMSQFLCNMKMFTYTKRQKKLLFIGKIEIDETDGILRKSNSGQTTSVYGSEIKKVWDPGGSLVEDVIHGNFSQICRAGFHPLNLEDKVLSTGEI